MKGPFDAPFARIDDLIFEPFISPCGGVVQISFNTQARLMLATGGSLDNATGSTGPELGMGWEIGWQKCSARPQTVPRSLPADPIPSSVLLDTTLVSLADPIPSPVLLNTTYGGSGCPAGSLTTTLIPSPLSLHVNTTQYNTTIGKNISAVYNRRNCQIRAAIQAPENYTLSIWQGSFSGTAALSAKVLAQMLVQAYLPGETTVGA